MDETQRKEWPVGDVWHRVDAAELREYWRLTVRASHTSRRPPASIVKLEKAGERLIDRVLELLDEARQELEKHQQLP